MALHDVGRLIPGKPDPYKLRFPAVYREGCALEGFKIKIVSYLKSMIGGSNAGDPFDSERPDSTFQVIIGDEVEASPGIPQTVRIDGAHLSLRRLQPLMRDMDGEPVANGPAEPIDDMGRIRIILPSTDRYGRLLAHLPEESMSGGRQPRSNLLQGARQRSFDWTTVERLQQVAAEIERHKLRQCEG